MPKVDILRRFDGVFHIIHESPGGVFINCSKNHRDGQQQIPKTRAPLNKEMFLTKQYRIDYLVPLTT